MRDFKFLSGTEEPTLLERLEELNINMTSQGIAYHELLARVIESTHELNREIERLQSQD